ncbi:hypothetical protein D1816_21875 [Aquimarina sp. AD10]|uniref:Uncharacterized protein n=1 Tax=Aquimarina aggregata TaxID=1642818 RepID=A0A163ATK9_9FLAO|nr:MULTISPECIES: hypothetical protein [Aquimarina]AXT62874.1 hypothetical protein D1816_21875 [Aquimarina sp. AD10]KZS40793.1 hypothetical protein AWE51_07530 [Aquimarina aggregata]RKM94242.1 hypothetical protein D7033_18515 [Aquimarina sp. AD10]
MKELQFPIKFTFNITTLANDFTAKDASGKTVAYVKQKMFKLKEDIAIYEDESKSKVNFSIKADKWIDFSAAYSFSDAHGNETGKIARKGWASLWKAEYELIDQHQKLQYHIREENGWVKVLDSLLGQIPVLSMLTGYLFNPSYKVVNSKDEIVIRLKKEPSFFGRKFEISKLIQIDQDDQERILLGLMMMILLERRRG